MLMLGNGKMGLNLGLEDSLIPKELFMRVNGKMEKRAGTGNYLTMADFNSKVYFKRV